MKIKTLVLCLLLTTALHAKGPKNYGSIYVSEIIKVIDGDTIKVNIEHIHPLIGESISVRLAGIDTPEIHSRDPALRERAQQAKAFTEEALKNADRILLKNMRRGKYFRILAEVHIDGINLTDKLLEAGHGVPYFGGKKPSW